jgi:flagellar FliL protein
MARQEEQTEEKQSTTTGLTKVMIIAGSLVVSAAIIGGVLIFVLGNQKALSVVEASTDKKTEQVKKKEAPVTYPLEAFIVNIGDGRDMRYLKLKLEFETTLTAEKVKLELDPYLPPIRDSILVLLTTKTIQDVQDLPGKNRLKDEILVAVNKVVPSRKITGVFFTDFVVQ